jgi:hypothetical protein
MSPFIPESGWEILFSVNLQPEKAKNPTGGKAGVPVLAGDEGLDFLSVLSQMEGGAEPAVFVPMAEACEVRQVESREEPERENMDALSRGIPENGFKVGCLHEGAPAASPKQDIRSFDLDPGSFEPVAPEEQHKDGLPDRIVRQGTSRSRKRDSSEEYSTTDVSGLREAFDQRPVYTAEGYRPVEPGKSQGDSRVDRSDSPKWIRTEAGRVIEPPEAGMGRTSNCDLPAEGKTAAGSSSDSSVTGVSERRETLTQRPVYTAEGYRPVEPDKGQGDSRLDRADSPKWIRTEAGRVIEPPEAGMGRASKTDLPPEGKTATGSSPNSSESGVSERRETLTQRPIYTSEGYRPVEPGKGQGDSRVDRADSPKWIRTEAGRVIEPPEAGIGRTSNWDLPAEGKTAAGSSPDSSVTGVSERRETLTQRPVYTAEGYRPVEPDKGQGDSRLDRADSPKWIRTEAGRVFEPEVGIDRISKGDLPAEGKTATGSPPDSAVSGVSERQETLTQRPIYTSEGYRPVEPGKGQGDSRVDRMDSPKWIRTEAGRVFEPPEVGIGRTSTGDLPSEGQTAAGSPPDSAVSGVSERRETLSRQPVYTAEGYRPVEPGKGQGDSRLDRADSPKWIRTEVGRVFEPEAGMGRTANWDLPAEVKTAAGSSPDSIVSGGSDRSEAHSQRPVFTAEGYRPFDPGKNQVDSRADRPNSPQRRILPAGDLPLPNLNGSDLAGEMEREISGIRDEDLEGTREALPEGRVPGREKAGVPEPFRIRNLDEKSNGPDAVAPKTRSEEKTQDDSPRPDDGENGKKGFQGRPERIERGAPFDFKLADAVIPEAGMEPGKMAEAGAVTELPSAPLGEVTPESTRFEAVSAMQDGIDPAEVVDRFLEKAVIAVRRGRSEARIDLKPDSLGHLRLQVSTERGQVMVRVLADNPEAGEILEAHIPQMKSELEKQGLSVEHFEVSVGTGSDGQSERHAEHPNPGPRPESGSGPRTGKTAGEAPEKTRWMREEGAEGRTVDYFA